MTEYNLFWYTCCMKKKKSLPKKICASWYHKKYFRYIVIVISLGIFLQGISLVFDIDILSLFHGSYNLWKILWGVLYMFVSGWVIYFLGSYERHKRKSYFVCPHCAAKHHHTKKA